MSNLNDSERDTDTTTPDRADDETPVLRRDILLLSTHLQGVHSPSATFKSNINNVSDLTIWSCVAFILSAHNPENCDSRQHVAITGRFEPNRVVAAVFTSASIHEATQLTQTGSVVVVEEVEKLSPDNVAHLLHEFDNLQVDVPFATHLRDTISILEWLSQPASSELDSHSHLRSAPVSSSMSDSQRQHDQSFLLFCFVAKRNYRQLFTQLQTGIALWNGHPLAVIHGWYCPCTQRVDAHLHPGTDTALDPTAARNGSDPLGTLCAAGSPPKLRTRSFQLRNLSMFGHLLKSHSISPDRDAAPGSDTGTYTVSSSTARSWAELLHTCYKTILAAVSRSGPSGSKLEAKYPETRAECAVLYAAMVALHELLRAGIVNHLITELVRKELDRRYVEVIQARASSVLELDYNRNDLKRKAEPHRHHVLRHLQSIVQPLHAASDIMAYFYGKPVNLKTQIPKPAWFTFDVIHVHVQTAATGSITGPGSLSDSIRDLLMSPDTDVMFDLLKEPAVARMSSTTAKIHPKAALINLAAGGWQISSQDENATKTATHLQNVFAGGIASNDIPVILSSEQRCCFCCALLGQRLRPWSGSGTSDQADADTAAAAPRRRPLKFIHEPDGTHGTIVPWMPPDGPGSAPEVLRHIRSRLLDVLRDEMVGTDTAPGVR